MATAKLTIREYALSNNQTNKEVLEILGDAGILNKNGKPLKAASFISQAALDVLTPTAETTPTPEVITMVHTPTETIEAEAAFAPHDDEWAAFSVESIKEAATENRARTASEKASLTSGFKGHHKKWVKFITAQRAAGQLTPKQFTALKEGTAPDAQFDKYRAAGIEVFTTKELRKKLSWVKSLQLRITDTERTAKALEVKKRTAKKHRRNKANMATLLDDADAALQALTQLSELERRIAVRGDAIFYYTAQKSDEDKLEGCDWLDGEFKTKVPKFRKLDEAGDIHDLDVEFVMGRLEADDKEFEEASLCELYEEREQLLELHHGIGKAALATLRHYKPKGFGPAPTEEALEAATLALLNPSHGRLEDEAATATHSELDEEGAL